MEVGQASSGLAAACFSSSAWNLSTDTCSFGVGPPLLAKRCPSTASPRANKHTSAPVAGRAPTRCPVAGFPRDPAAHLVTLTTRPSGQGNFLAAPHTTRRRNRRRRSPHARAARAHVVTRCREPYTYGRLNDRQHAGVD
eukprot:1189732-Prorocentrum_minimum.AAC.4